ncbi:hypothetical protein D9C73_022657 [Collichthys lucidus]|uniref:Uncharacterized protein n=1 Tax=Collichthys lucidus TaxID=240159 RepID=A0A4V6AVB6_COLLU|nr:hypothetical protein D9C73_022657 [Collichthys lucidus]
MQVIGVVEGTSCPCDQLVLMTCEDTKVYGYDGEELHVVAASLQDLVHEGIEYPASKSYYNGEAFKNMKDKDWDKVRKGAVGRRLDEEHRKLVTTGKSNLKNFKLTYGSGCSGDSEVLHSILFLGHINEPRFTPEDILCTKLNEYKGRYPRPFQCYSTQLPKRAPISCVLEMIVSMTGQEEVKVIFQRLLQLIDKLKEGETKHLVSNTFCVSQPNKSPETARYYGVSMSTSGRDSGRIMVNACCLSRYWDSYVADAVMTYNPNKQKKTYFDATIKLPNEVKCQAFGFSEEMTEMPPCKSCSNLFGLTTSSTRIWPYGNCAEPESLSNLLQNEKEVKEKSEPKSKTCTDENRRRAEDSVWKETERMLREKLSDRYEYGRQFYTPQV